MKIRVGQHSDPGPAGVNQDFHGAALAPDALARTKGIAVALADGIGSSDVSRVASEFAVHALLEDYYCTPDTWPVRKSAERVLAATNSWLHSRTAQSPWRHDMDRGYVCTLSALVLQGDQAHVLHVGDSRVWRVADGSLEPLTQDHRAWVSARQSYLSRAMGFHPQLEIDYLALPVAAGDVFVLTTDGVHEHLAPAAIAEAIAASPGDLDLAARAIVEAALAHGGDDNATVQIVHVEQLDDGRGGGIEPAQLPPAGLLAPRSVLDGWRIERELHASARSHLYLAVDVDSGTRAAIKTLAVELQEDPAALDRFAMEEWIARRIASAHVLAPVAVQRARTRLYVATEYIEGQTLAQWLADHPQPPLEDVRRIVEQLARGLQAFHRREMLHQDLRPENVMIDAAGTAKIIDFGSVHVAGLSRGDAVLGTTQYAAPEYFLGEPGTPASDLYSLAAIAYQMLCGRLPYGARAAQARTRAAQRRLVYTPVLSDEREIPSWVDDALRKALAPDPRERYAELSEFVHDLRHPNASLALRARPLIARDPVRFWKTLCLVLGVMVVLLLFVRLGH